MNIPIIFAIIVAVIQVVEQLLGAGTGPQKKQAVIDFIMKVNQQLNLKIPEIVMNNIGIIIDLLVALFNGLGPFVKSPK